MKNPCSPFLRPMQRTMAVGLFLLPTTVLFVVAPLYSPEVSYAESEMAAPGDCTRERHRILKAAVSAACKTGVTTKCEEKDDCPVLAQKIQLISACIGARVQVQTECFRGGVPGDGHSIEINNQRGARRRCENFHTAKVVKGECKLQLCPVPKSVHLQIPSDL